MITSVTMSKQTPSVEDNWLYQDDKNDNRTFSKCVYLPDGAEPWAECSEAEKQAWEEAHPIPEPEQQ